MKALIVGLAYILLLGCSHAPKPQAQFWIEPSDPDIRLERDGEFLQKAKMSQRKKTTYPGI